MFRIEAVSWGEDDERVEHVARHNITPEEVQDVLFGRHRQEKGREGALRCYGITWGDRFLLVVIRPKPRRVAYIITARDMDDAEKRRYNREEGRP